MNKIVVRHSSIVINNYELGDSPRLESFFSIYDRNYHCSFLKGLEYIEEEKKLILPRGIDIYFLENLFGEDAVIDERCDQYDKTEPIMIKYLPRDEVQKEALGFMLGERVNYRGNKLKSQLSVNLNTGVGKTYCSVASIAYMNIRSIIITSSINWLEQWKKCIIEYTDTRPNEIYFLTGSPSIINLFKKDMNKYKFILASHATIKSYGDKYGWDKVTELFKYMKIGLKFYDESHLNFDNMCKIDFYTNTYKTYYVTATPARSDKDENQIYQLYFKNVPSIDLFDEDNDPHTKYFALKYNSEPTPQEISACKNKYGLDRNKYTEYIVGKENYYKMLRIILKIALSQSGKTLIYIGTNKAINTTRDWILENYPELHNSVGVYTSITPESEKPNQLHKKIILSTTKSCGAAMDIKGLRITVVIAEPFKSEVLARQTLGRTRDKNTLYIEVVDTGFININKYYCEKKNVFEKYALSCTETKIPKLELEYRSNSIIRDREIAKRPLQIMRTAKEFNEEQMFFGEREDYVPRQLKKVMFKVNEYGSMI